MRTRFLGFILWVGLAPGVAGAEHPNFLIIIAEDMSPNLGCYGDSDVQTPNLDALAARSVKYTRAYTATGVCATSRSSIITAMHPSSIGTQHMRSRVVLPASIRPYPAYLREAGYFCVNRGKEDFNFETPPGVWDAKGWKASDWTHAKPGQPFLAIFNFSDTHESRLWKKARTRMVDDSRLMEGGGIDPSQVSPPAYLPTDDPKVRAEWARYCDLVSLMDEQYIGPLLNRLVQTGAVDDTIVVFCSDHGAPFPHAKQWITEAGTRVPLLVHFPKNWQHLAPGAPGTEQDRLLSLMDLGPSILSLAAVSIPDHMEGRAFLGANEVSPREYLYFTRDRMDERIDFIRAVRDRRFRYVRNFMPQVPSFPWLDYMEQLEASKAFRRIQAGGELGRFGAFLAPTKPGEELYDLEADPSEEHNLAFEPAHAATLKRFRGALQDWMLETRDSGFLPEQILLEAEESAGSIHAFCHDEARYPLRKLIVEELQMDDASEVIRYWAALRCGKPEALRTRLAEEVSPEVKVAVAWSLARLTNNLEAIDILTSAAQSERSWTRLLALNALDYLGENARPALRVLKKIASAEETPDNLYDRWVVEHLLRQLEGGE